MRLWCVNCNTAVDACSEEFEEVMDDEVTGSTIKYIIYSCPICGEEVIDKPGECIRCGAEIDPDGEICGACIDDIEHCIEELQCDGKYSRKEIIDLLGAYLEGEI